MTSDLSIMAKDPGKTDPTVFIVVVNWNGLEDTLDCLEAVTTLEYPKRQVVVVDNGSEDGSPDAIQTKHPDVTIIRNGANLGYTGGNNVGLRYAMSQGADYIWLLNNDAVPTPSSLSILVGAAEQRQQIGLLGPVIHYHDRRQEIQFAGTLLHEPSQADAYIRTLDPAVAAGIPGRPVLVGTALLVRSQLVSTIGYLDERYFAYCEDWDYSLRALAAGFDVVLEPAATVFHKPTGSLGRDSSVKEHYMVRNRYLLWRTHLTGWARRVYPARYLGWVLERALNNRAEGHEPLVGAALDGAWEALRGRFGPWRPEARMPRPLTFLLSRVLLAWHPYFWIMLFKGQFHAVSVQAFRRALRRVK